MKKRIFLCFSIILGIVGLILKSIIESKMMATPSTLMVPATIFIVSASFILIIHTELKERMERYTLSLAMFLLTIKELLWSGSTISIILYIMLTVSMFKDIKSKTLNIMIIIDCIVKFILTIWYIANSVNYYNSIYFAVPTIICLLSSLSVNIGVWLICYNQIKE